MNQRFPYVYPDDRLSRAREIMRDTGARILPVIDDSLNMRLKGIIYRLDLLNVSSTRTNLLVRDVLNEPPVLITPKMNVMDAIKKMLRVDEWYAPVVDEENRVKGILGLEGVIRYYLINNPELFEKPVSDYYTREVESVHIDDEVSRLWYKMLKHKYAGFPVVKENNIIVGVITQYDLLKKGMARVELESESKPRKIYVRELMTTPAITVMPNSSLKEAALQMIKRNIGRIYVSDDKKRLIGVLDREDIVRYLFYRGQNE